MTLAHHSFEEWAEAMTYRLLALGCSKVYTDAEARRIIAAKPKSA